MSNLLGVTYIRNSRERSTLSLSHNSKQLLTRKETALDKYMRFILVADDKPLGPLKSGMPVDVLIPAPVSTTQCLLFFIISVS